MSADEPSFTRQFDWKLTRRILGYVRRYAGVAFGALGLSLVLATASQSFPFLQRLIIDRYLAPPEGSPFALLSFDQRLSGVWFIAGVYLALAGVEFLARYGFQYSLVWLGQHVLFDLRAELFAKMQRLQLAYFDKNPVGRLVTRVTSDVDAINGFITNGLVTLAQSVFVLLAVLAYMFALSWRLALIASLAMPLLFLATRFFQHRFRDAYRQIRIKQAIVNTALNENITGMSTVQLFNREERNRADFDGLNRDFLDANLASIRWFAYFFPTVGLISNAALAVLLWYGGGQTLQAAITVGTLFAFTQYVRNFFQPLSDLSEVFNTLQAAMASAERIFGVLDEPEQVTDPAPALPVRGFRGEVELKDVWFSYAETKDPKDDQWVLRGVNLHVRAGESVALVGATGAGKTSIISLVSRFYDVQRGEVRVDGVDVRRYAQRELRRHVGVVLQDVFLFAGTIASNLRMNDETLPMSRVEEACRYVGVHDFIQQLPGGYDAEVKERGATLSAGQKQLLAFARALIQNPDILLVLDEATANVDTETELRIQAAQEKLMQNRTSIIIAHRLSTIRHCDRIVVLRRGQVVEEGLHAQLLAKGGYYATLYRLQYAEQEAA